MKKVTKELFGKGYSPGTISRINKQLTQEMRAWLEQPIVRRFKPAGKTLRCE
jgi:transposase-like protein